MHPAQTLTSSRTLCRPQRCARRRPLPSRRCRRAISPRAPPTACCRVEPTAYRAGTKPPSHRRKSTNRRWPWGSMAGLIFQRSRSTANRLLISSKTCVPLLCVIFVLISLPVDDAACFSVLSCQHNACFLGFEPADGRPEGPHHHRPPGPEDGGGVPVRLGRQAGPPFDGAPHGPCHIRRKWCGGGGALPTPLPPTRSSLTLPLPRNIGR